jgi:hypothetical protein
MYYVNFWFLYIEINWAARHPDFQNIYKFFCKKVKNSDKMRPHRKFDPITTEYMIFEIE